MDGPGRPVYRALTARRMTWLVLPDKFSRSRCLVTLAKLSIESNIGKTPWRSRGWPRGSRRMGTESEKDVATPEYAFSAPGPYCMAKTPGGRPLVMRL